ncbi:hypothetical protein TB2_019212 [Malus domestica]
MKAEALTLVQSACYPIAEYLAVRHNRAHGIALGTFLWATATFLVAFSSTFTELNERSEELEIWWKLNSWVQIWIYSDSGHDKSAFLGKVSNTLLIKSVKNQKDRAREIEHKIKSHSAFIDQVAMSRALNGIGLALLTPAIQSLVADSTDDNNRGMAFGWLQLTGNVGSIIGGLCSILIAPITVMGIPGWRISLHLVGFISVVVGVLVRLYATDPHFPDGETKDSSQNSSSSLWSHVKELALEAKSVIKIPSFQIVVAQGVTGSFP